DHNPIPVDVRVLTATNKDPEKLVSEGKFRQDLYFRINVFPIHCPRLAERPEDIPMLVQHFIRRNMMDSDKKILGVTPGALEKLMAYDWPGNIRELRNTIEYALVLCPGGSIDLNHLPARITGGKTKPLAGKEAGDNENDRARLEQLLRQTGWNQSETARQMGVSRVTVWKKINKYNIQRPWSSG
ncbi:MAG: helix-turn-helix domain-containing protein, partial [Desulfobacterales bacterium]